MEKLGQVADELRAETIDATSVTTIEDGAAGGFGTQVLTLPGARGALDAGLKVPTKALRDRLVAHGEPEERYGDAGLRVRDIVATCVAALGKGWLDRDVATIGRLRSR